MATVEQRYEAATDYVRRAIRAVEAGAFHSPASLLAPVFATEVYAGQVKTENVENELTRIEGRWLRATSDAERAHVAREAELLADRTQESLPGAPQDRQRTNLYKGEKPSAAPASSYAGEASSQASEAWGWAKEKAGELRDDAAGIGKWLLVGGGLVLAMKAVDLVRERQRRNRRGHMTTAQLLNARLEEAAELRNPRKVRR
jgi:hypothetical protein